MRVALASAICTMLAALPAAALEVSVLGAEGEGLRMSPVALPGGKMSDYTLGIGSGAFRHPSDPANVIWTVGDRGPNMTCAEAERLLGKETADACRKLRLGRVYPTPDYAPAIYKLELDPARGAFRLAATIPLKTRSGKPISGLLNPQTVATKDAGMDLAGRPLPDSPDNIDMEAIVRLASGVFWVADEMGPSLVEVAADGRMLRRLVPADAVKDYAGSEAEVVGALPAILSKRTGNRGFESLALSPDERHLFAIMQNPLANPNPAAYQAARNTRIFKIEIATLKVVAEYVYQLDLPQSFALDPSDRQSDPRISEMTALGQDRLLVLERTERTTKLHEISLVGATDILGSRWDDLATAPSLEQNNDLGPTGITPVSKVLRFDTARDFPKAAEKMEGVAFLPDGAMVLINDNDFGIRGDKTEILIVRGAVQPDASVLRRP